MVQSPQRSCDQAGACAVIPVFNHGRTVGAVVRGALEHASTVLVCDDGSTDGSGDEAEKAGAIVLRQPTNQGKGAALRRLLEEAGRRGFRYAIALDADGQHLPEDLPKVAAATREDPGSLVIGARDLIAAGAPSSSEFGRKFSNFWVWFEAGARVDDSQSGFRAYPLPETLKLRTLNRRYDFEVEILLQAAWAGLPLRSVPIGVIYPKDRISHFRPFLDNARISLLNTLTCLRLLLPLPLAPRLRGLPHQPGLSLFRLRRWAWLGGEGPVWRTLAAIAGILPVLLMSSPWWLVLAAFACALAGLGAVPALASAWAFQSLRGRGLAPLPSAGIVVGALLALGVYEAMTRPRAPSRWTGQSRGGVLGHWFFYQVTRVFGISAAYWALYPVAFYFVLGARTARNASMQFLDRAIGPARGFRRFARTYQHILTFARTLVDRALLATRGPSVFRVEEIGLDYIRNAAAEGRGGILLTAHMGNWDVAGGLLRGGRGGDVNLAIVAFQGEQERIARYVKKAHGPGPRVIAVGGDEMLSSLEMIRALREGTLLAIQGDRSVDRHVARVPFLGREASFPVGPFMLAAVSGAPLIATFSIQLGPATYRFFAQPPLRLRFERGRDRDTQLREWVEQYVRQLESLAREFPYQWFNFYDFWDAGPTLPVKSAKPPAAS
ncbi:glycosyltransferase [Vitiosangium sp. GDMCC 1.1324]|uniref:glycosyltransferase family 2 protein n=1 Tax=Vitiosangium sp. (strain GDMCC 1.1324) TaxID=2138576 RepID=UPI001E440E95|nr:glycosyltransferase [Vitiosangium sp. GDMCC 1.1324]